MAPASTIEAPDVATTLADQVENVDDQKAFREEFEHPTETASAPAVASKAADDGKASAANPVDKSSDGAKPADQPSVEESDEEKWMRERAESLTAEEKVAKAQAKAEPAAPAAPELTAKEKELVAQLDDAKKAAEDARSKLAEATGSAATIDPKTFLAAEKIIAALPEGELKTEVQTVVNEYPEVMRAVIAMSTAIARSQLPKDGTDSKPIQEALAQLRSDHTNLAYELQKTAFLNTVERGVRDDEGKFVKGHADANEIVHTEEFATWRKELPPTMQKVIGSWNALDGIRVISAFKEYRARQIKKGKDAQLADRKGKKDGLLGDSLRDENAAHSRSDSKKSTPESDKNDFDREFDKAAKGE
jgi:hypothetical protein